MHALSAAYTDMHDDGAVLHFVLFLFLCDCSDCIIMHVRLLHVLNKRLKIRRLKIKFSLLLLVLMLQLLLVFAKLDYFFRSFHVMPLCHAPKMSPKHAPMRVA